MRESPTTSLADFVRDPRLALVLCRESVLPPAVRRVGEFLEARWPDISLRTVRDEATLRAFLGDGGVPDLLLLVPSADFEIDLLALEQAAPHLPKETIVLVARPSGVLVRLALSVPRLGDNACIGGRAADFLEHRSRVAARRRLHKFRVDRLQRINQRLRQLSLEDALTRILNRRGFFRFLRAEWSRAARYESEMACIVVDIDNFKRLNDTYGHAVGDWMLRGFADILKKSCRNSDILGRVGGEEFCVILPACNEHQAVLWAEKTRRRIADTLLHAGNASLRLTASFGVASSHASLRDENELIDLADRAMLVAKHGGRNRVVAASAISGARSAEARLSPTSRVVRLLLDSLAIRDPQTARHSQRVSQYSTLLAKEVGLGDNEIWITEIGGLLHDLGKMGLPDAVLQKPDKLSPTERDLVTLSLASSHDIVRNAFGDGPLSETVRCSRVWFRDGEREKGGRLPVSARIVAIADAFDAMTNSQAYRPSLPRSAAAAELLRCSGTQFDGELVRRFNDMLAANN